MATIGVESSASILSNFNPHHPRGWRRLAKIEKTPEPIFQSTPPSRVATRAAIRRSACSPYFNPHHPRGWRPSQTRPTTTSSNFNPHHPRGWRQSLSELCQGASLFQSTPPSRVATRLSARYSRLIAISIHTTLAGGDYTSTPREGKSKSFQSTPPSRVATRDRVAQIYCHIISIHTTLAGGDCFPRPTV